MKKKVQTHLLNEWLCHKFIEVAQMTRICTPKKGQNVYKNEKKEVRRALQTIRRRIGLLVLILALSSLRAGTHYRNLHGMN